MEESKPWIRWRHLIASVLLIACAVIAFTEGREYERDIYDRQQFIESLAKPEEVTRVVENVLICESGIVASGHKTKIDDKAIQQFYNILWGRKVKSYITHGRGSTYTLEDRTLKEVGYFYNFKIKGGDLYADFRLFDSVVKRSPHMAELLIELVNTMPNEFGVSMVSTSHLVRMVDGKEVPFIPRRNTITGQIIIPTLEKDFPIFRPLEVISIDWVTKGAATPAGVFKNSDIDL